MYEASKRFSILYSQGVWRGGEKLQPEDSVASILKQGTLSLGFIGLAECLVALTGKHHGEDEESWKLGYEIISFMRDRMDKATEEHKLNFSVIATPAEGLSGKFVKKDREEFGVISGITNHNYYTNSFHIPVYYNMQAINKIRLEGPSMPYVTGTHYVY